MGTDLNEQYDPATQPPRHIEAFNIRYKLFKNDFAPDADSIEADFTEADFSGYEDHFSGDNLVMNLTEERFEHEVGLASFDHNGGATANTIYGWFAIDSTALSVTGAQITEVVAYERFATPITMADLGDHIPIHLHKHATGVDS